MSARRTWKIRARPPQGAWWEEAVLAARPGGCRLVLAWAAEEASALEMGPLGLSTLVGVDGWAGGGPPLRPPPGEEGRQRFGIMAVRGAGGERPRSSPAEPCWMLALEWDGAGAAWESLLSTLEAIRPRGDFAIPLEFLLPTLFVARMADHPHGSSLDVVRQWGPLLEEAEEALLPLLYALAGLWSNGPSQAAEDWRLVRDPLPLAHPDALRLLDSFAAAFGHQLLEEARATERFEPTVLRLLDAASARLWQLAAPAAAELRGHILAEPGLRALLPIARWSAWFDVQEAFGRRFPGLEDLVRNWKETW